MARQYYSIAAVTCEHFFPIDMLRYDRCWPVDERDSNNIADTLSYEMMLHGERYEYPPIFVARIHERGQFFTTERWKSRGAHLVEVAVNETSYSTALLLVREYKETLTKEKKESHATH